MLALRGLVLAGSVLAGVAVAGGCDEGDQSTASRPPAAQSPGSATEGRSASDPRPDPPVSGSPRALVAEQVRDVQEGLVDGVPSSVCRELTEAFRERLEPDCERHVAMALRRARAAGARPVLSKIRSVQIGGDRAVVTIEKPGGEVQRIAVVRDGTWRLPALDLGVPPGLQPIDR